jgi:hypothetical protein
VLSANVKATVRLGTSPKAFPDVIGNERIRRSAIEPEAYRRLLARGTRQ